MRQQLWILRDDLGTGAQRFFATREAAIAEARKWHSGRWSWLVAYDLLPSGEFTQRPNSGQRIEGAA